MSTLTKVFINRLKNSDKIKTKCIISENARYRAWTCILKEEDFKSVVYRNNTKRAVLIEKIKSIIQKFLKVFIIICDLIYLKQKLNQSNIRLDL